MTVGTRAPAPEPVPSASGVPALEIRSLSKSYGAVRALRTVSLEMWPGECLGLLGDNGAGKTTLVKCVSGLVRPDRGTILVDGEAVRIDTPEKARKLGIETVHQALSLIESMDVTANLFLKREIVFGRGPLRWLRWLNQRAMYDQAQGILDQLQIRIPSVRQPVERLSGGQRQAVAVGRAVGWGRHIVLMDEPAAALGVEQAHHVLELTDRLKKQGVAVLFISHNMQHVVEVCDRAVVLLHGRKVGDVAVRDVTARDLVDLITGARATEEGKE